LFALLDGLAVHAAMRPDPTNAEGLLAVLNHQPPAGPIWALHRFDLATAATSR
jgi:hypothetical protein